MLQHLRPALVMIATMTVLTGLLYPLAVTGLAQLAFPLQANGSLVTAADGRVIGSDLVGQPFAGERWFHPRPSAAGDGYDGSSTGGSNLAPTSSALLGRIDDLARSYRAANPAGGPVPVDLVTASGSGLDPHLSPEAALFQVPRIAHARDLDETALTQLVFSLVEHRTLGLMGEPRVNVLRLNLALERLGGEAHPR